MKLVYAIPNRATSKRPAARHIDNGNGKPLCVGNGREPYFCAPEEGETYLQNLPESSLHDGGRK